MSHLRAATGVLTLLIAGLFPATAPAAQATLTPHVAEYKVKISIASGELRTELRQTPRGYMAIHSLVPKGLSRLFADGSITEVSEFIVDEDAITPVSYLSDDTLDSDEEVHARVQFDWDALQASGTVNDEPLLAELEALTHDRGSIQYALMHDLLNDRVETQYRMFETDELRLVNIRRVGTKSVRVPAGKFDAIGIQHQAEGSSRAITLWCVEELGYLPVIIEQHRKGKLRVEAKLREYAPVTSAEED